VKRQSRIGRRILAAGLLLGCASIPWAAVEPPERTARDRYQAARAEEVAAAKPRAWLGVFLSDAVDGGVEVVGLVPEGPAQRAGLREGDLILEVNGTPALNQAVLDQRIQDSGPGGEVELGLLRSGKSLALRVELGERGGRPLPPRLPLPPEPAAWTDTERRDRIQSRMPRSFYGLQVAEMTPALREHFGAPPDAGVLVLGVDAAQDAATIGFQVGDVLVQLGGRGIRDEDQLRWMLSSWTTMRPLTANVIRGGEPVLVEFRPAAEPKPAGPAAPPAPAPTPEAERELLERRLQLEIQRLEERIRTLRLEIEQLRQRR